MHKIAKFLDLLIKLLSFLLYSIIINCIIGLIYIRYLCVNDTHKLFMCIIYYPQ